LLKDRSEIYPAKLAFYKQWLSQLPGSRLIATDNSGHGIPYEEPELVIDAVHELVEKVRAEPPARRRSQ